MIKPAAKSKQIPIFLTVLALLVLAKPAAAFSNNRYQAYGKKSIIAAIEKPQVLGTAVVNDAYITNLVTDAVNKMVAQGLLKGEKGDKGDPASFPTLASVDPNSSNFQQAYIPAAVSAANQQTFFAATNLSGDNITVNSVNTGDLDSTGNFTNEGSASFSGTASFTGSTTISDLLVSTIESAVSIANFDGFSWTNASSKELKENFVAVTPADVLNKIDSLPIYTWNYKNENTNVVHMGPTAEDFYSTFALGNSSSSISTIDPAGVALAGIQALDAKVSALELQIKALQAQPSERPEAIPTIQVPTISTSSEPSDAPTSNPPADNSDQTATATPDAAAPPVATDTASSTLTNLTTNN